MPFVFWLGRSATANPFTSTYERVSPSLAKNPCVFWPESPTSARRANGRHSAGPGSDAIPSTRAVPSRRPR